MITSNDLNFQHYSDYSIIHEPLLYLKIQSLDLLTHGRIILSTRATLRSASTSQKL